MRERSRARARLTVYGAVRSIAASAAAYIWRSPSRVLAGSVSLKDPCLTFLRSKREIEGSTMFVTEGDSPS
jgi:hypothetical protein